VPGKLGWAARYELAKKWAVTGATELGGKMGGRAVGDSTWMSAIAALVGAITVNAAPAIAGADWDFCMSLSYSTVENCEWDAKMKMDVCKTEDVGPEECRRRWDQRAVDLDAMDKRAAAEERTQAKVSAAKVKADCDRRGRPEIGMSREQVIATCLGKPDHKNVTVLPNGLRHEQWVYDGGSYLNFSDGVLTSGQFSGH
jgi:hypothetical protein